MITKLCLCWKCDCASLPKVTDFFVFCFPSLFNTCSIICVLLCIVLSYYERKKRRKTRKQQKRKKGPKFRSLICALYFQKKISFDVQRTSSFQCLFSYVDVNNLRDIAWYLVLFMNQLKSAADWMTIFFSSFSSKDLKSCKLSTKAMDAKMDNRKTSVLKHTTPSKCKQSNTKRQR